MAFFTFLCVVDLAFLMMGIAHLLTGHAGKPHLLLTKAGGGFALLGIVQCLVHHVCWSGSRENKVWTAQSPSHDQRRILTVALSFVRVPLFHFPWGTWSKGGTNSE